MMDRIFEVQVQVPKAIPESPTRARRGSKYPIVEASGSKNHSLKYRVSGPEIFDMGYLEPLGFFKGSAFESNTRYGP